MKTLLITLTVCLALVSADLIGINQYNWENHRVDQYNSKQRDVHQSLPVSGDLFFNLLNTNRHDYYHDCNYVIVGPGGGGAVTGGKLAEGLPNKKVCLVERGVEYLTDPRKSLVELVDNLYLLNSQRPFLEQITSIIQQTLLNSTTFTPRPLVDVVGNVTGGGGSNNAMGYRRPQKWVFDNLNQTGWSYADALAAFQEIESRVEIMEMTNTYTPIQGLMATAFQNSGYPAQSSPLDNIKGHWQSYWTSKWINDTLYRTSSYTGYVIPNLNRTNLKVFPSVKVHRVIFFPTLKGPRAIGVIGVDQRNGKIVIFRARDRVILSAGVYRTPQLLMLSGVGPRSTLIQKKILPLVDLPVGQNFWTHTNLQTVHLPNPGFITSFTQTENRKNNMFGAGPLDKNQTEWIVGLSTIYIPEYYAELPIGLSEIITTNVKSRGVITINSTDADDQPIIDHRVFTHPDDIEAVKKSFRTFRQVMSQPQAQQAYILELAPGLTNIPTDDDDLVEAYIRSSAGIAHVGGGCHIGSVVDNKLRVLGTQRLHVCDMSVYPSPVQVNTYPTAMLAGYQCAKFILQEDS